MKRPSADGQGAHKEIAVSPQGCASTHAPSLAGDALVQLGRGDALVFDGVLGAAEALALNLALARDPCALTPVGVGQAAVLAPDVRGDRTRWLERSEAPDLFGLFDHIGRELREKAWLGTGEFEVQLAFYPGDGARYRVHRDAFIATGRRRATVIYYLNADWRSGDGGELRVFSEVEAGVARELEPLLDRLVVFLAEKVAHEVLPCRAARWAVTAWFLGPAVVPSSPRDRPAA